MSDHFRIVAIDPGKNGGIVRLTPEGHRYDVRAYKMPETRNDIASTLAVLLADGPSIVLIEQLGQLPADIVFVNGKKIAVPKQGMKSIRAQFLNYGILLGVLAASKVRVHEVTAQKWQAEFGLVRPKGSAKESGTEKKNRHKAKAQQLFPDMKITHAITDALLLGEWGWRYYVRGGA